MQDLFKYVDNNSRFAFGYEPEFNNRSNHSTNHTRVTWQEFNRINSRSNTPIKGLTFKPDGSNADVEMDLPVLADCNMAWEYLRDCFKIAIDNNSFVNTECSSHVHISTLPILPSLTNEQFTRKSIEMKNQFSDANYDHYLEKPSNLSQLFVVNKQIPLDVIKDIGFRLSTHIDFFSTTIARSRRDGYFCRYPKTPQEILRARPTVEGLRQVFNHRATSYKYSALNVNHYNSKKTIEFRSHGGTLEYRKLITWFKFLSNIVDHSLQKRFKAHTVQQELTSPSYIGRSANTTKSQLWAFCRGQARSTREIMAHCNINNPQSVRRTISEIRRNEHYDPFVVTHNQQEFNVRYGQSIDHGDNGYEILINKTVDIPSDNLTLNSEQLGNSELVAGLDNQTLADLNERIRQLN